MSILEMILTFGAGIIVGLLVLGYLIWRFAVQSL